MFMIRSKIIRVHFRRLKIRGLCISTVKNKGMMLFVLVICAAIC